MTDGPPHAGLRSATRRVRRRHSQSFQHAGQAQLAYVVCVKRRRDEGIFVEERSYERQHV